MKKERTYSKTKPCQGCGAEIVAVGCAKWCLACRDKSNRRKAFKRIEAAMGPDIANQIREQVSQQAGKTPQLNIPPEIADVWARELVAVYLQVTPDPVRACAMAGLGKLDLATASALAAEAREHCQPILDNDQVEAGRLLRLSLFGLAIRALASLPRMGINSIGSTMQSIAKTLELTQGTARPVYSQVEVIFPSTQTTVTVPPSVAVVQSNTKPS